MFRGDFVTGFVNLVCLVSFHTTSVMNAIAQRMLIWLGRQDYISVRSLDRADSFRHTFWYRGDPWVHVCRRIHGRVSHSYLLIEQS